MPRDLPSQRTEWGGRRPQGSLTGSARPGDQGQHRADSTWGEGRLSPAGLFPKTHGPGGAEKNVTQIPVAGHSAKGLSGRSPNHQGQQKQGKSGGQSQPGGRGDAATPCNVAAEWGPGQGEAPCEQVPSKRLLNE